MITSHKYYRAQYYEPLDEREKEQNCVISFLSQSSNVLVDADCSIWKPYQMVQDKQA